MNFWEVSLLIAAGGALGGVTEYLGIINFSKHKLLPMGEITQASGKRLFGGVLIAALVGITGAFAIQFGFILLGSFSSDPTVSRRLFLFSISCAAGFGAPRILPRLANSVERQLSQLELKDEKLEAKLDQQSARMTEQEEKVKGQIESAVREVASTREAIAKALSHLERRERRTEEYEIIKSELIAACSEDRLNRVLHIVFGRLHRMYGDIDAAIEILSDFIANKAEAEQVDADYAAALFNRACYNAERYAKNTGDPAAKDYLSMVKSDLERSIKIRPANLEDARTDSDFVSVRDLEEFKAVFFSKE